MSTSWAISRAANRLLRPKTSAETDQLHVNLLKAKTPTASRLLPTQSVSLIHTSSSSSYWFNGTILTQNTQNINYDSWPIQPDILSPPLLQLTSRKPLWLDLQPVDIKSRWRHNWKSAQVVNSHLVCYPTIRQPGFDLPRQQWSLLNRFRTEQGHCGACRRKWQLIVTILCPCGETQMMSHIVESCPPDQTEWRLISATLCGADEDAVSWLTSYGS